MSMGKFEAERAPQCALRTSFVLAVGTTFLLSGTVHRDVMTGFGIGSVLSILSLCSLMLLVPMLLRPRPSRSTQTLSVLMLVGKLPAYGFGVWIAVGPLKGSPLALGAGIALVPAVITLQTLGAILNTAVGAKSKTVS